MRQPTRRLSALRPRTVALLLALLAAAPAFAQLSPGPLHGAHQKLEGVENCTRCHEVGRKLSADRCLACHTALATRVRAKQGLHAQPGHETCEKCHVEHQGRDYQLIWWGRGGRAAFDHAQTGWKLEGKHAGPACERCHKPDVAAGRAALVAGAANPQRTFLGLRADCVACHRDPHSGQLGPDCRSCHGLENWRGAAGFDHARTHFPLTGRHRDAACAKCHPALPAGVDVAAPEATAAGVPINEARRQWRGVAFAGCADCHKDPHGGRLGGECASCHATESWRAVSQARFDHERTRYPLRGKHVTVPCKGCHRPDRPARGLKFATCTDCHAERHAGQFAKLEGGGDCARCHSVEGYVPSSYTVERHAGATYPLAGAHLAVPCVGCHARLRAGAPVSDIPFHFASTRCQVCHRDPHRDEAKPWVDKGGCESCHRLDAWSVAVYDHATTRFPLTDKHATARCSACHQPLAPDAPPGAIHLRGVDRACESCHRDPHAGQFRAPTGGGTACERCHETANWRAGSFDHNREAAFRIDGAHARTRCAQCHFREGEGEAAFTRYKPLGQECAACHRANPARPEAAVVPPQEGTP